ncbi:MAG: hypothetical protein ACE5IY_20380 [bacterium]
MSRIKFHSSKTFGYRHCQQFKQPFFAPETVLDFRDHRSNDRLAAIVMIRQLNKPIDPGPHGGARRLCIETN